MKPRTQPKRISDKKLKALGNKMPFSTVTSAKKPLKKRARPMNRVNGIRKATAFARAYGSHERVAFVKSLPCAACGVVGFSENAHIETGGMGRKADYTKIVPLCGRNYYDAGCHSEFHTAGQEWFKRAYGIDLEAEAAKCQERWLSSMEQEKE